MGLQFSLEKNRKKEPSSNSYSVIAGSFFEPPECRFGKGFSLCEPNRVSELNQNCEFVTRTQIKLLFINLAIVSMQARLEFVRYLKDPMIC